MAAILQRESDPLKIQSAEETPDSSINAAANPKWQTFLHQKSNTSSHLEEFTNNMDEPLPPNLANLAGEVCVDGTYGTEVNIGGDAWGASFVALVRTLTVLHMMQRNGVSLPVHVARISFMVVTILTNLALQVTCVLYIDRFVVEPAVGDVQKSYIKFLSAVTDESGTFVASQWHNYENKHEVCGLALLNRPFCYCVFMLWVLSQMNELRQVQRNITHVWTLPTVEKNSGMLEFVETRNFAADGKCHIVGMTWSVRFAVYLTVCIPRLWVCGYLTLVGCRWLCSSPDCSEMILNSLKLAFVHRIDEVVYEVVLPIASRQQVSHTKVFFKTGNEPSSLREVGNTELIGYLRSALYLIATVAFVVWYLEIHQSVVPSEILHVNQVCHHYREQLSKNICHGGHELGSCYPPINVSSFHN